MIKCPYSKLCGSCKYINIDYKEEIEIKKNYISSLLKNFNDISIVHSMDNPYYYRNKVTRALGLDKEHNIISGLYQLSTHKIVKIDSCLIEDKDSNNIIKTILELFKRHHIKVYDEYKESGLIRHILIKKGFNTNEIMVVLVSYNLSIPNIDEFVSDLINRYPSIKTIILNENKEYTSMILGEKERIIYGNGYIKDILLDKTFRISSKSFYQVNPIQAKTLYERVIALASIKNTDTVLDAYCGTGTIGICLSNKAKNVIGVELNTDAIKDAIVNEKINNINNIKFINEDCTKYILKEARFKKSKIDVVIMDPPRTGSTKEFLNSLLNLEPRTIIYVSCGPETLKRDLYTLTKKYNIEKIECVDMFSHTDHIETVCLLVCKK